MDSEKLDVFISRLSALRKAKKITQQQMAEIIHISRTGYSSWEQGLSQPSLVHLVKLCQYFNVSSDYLLGMTDIMKPQQSPVSEDDRISNILTVEVPRDPFSDLSEKQRALVENLLATMRSQNEQEKAVDEEEKEA